MFIYGLEKSSLIDYPGKIACVVFLAGCNFRCRFCHNPELVLPELIKKQPKFPEKKFFDFLKTRQKLLDGVVITGGEPTIHQNLPEFIKKIKDFGFLVKLDTNGTNPEMLEKLINNKLIDYIAMDVKASLKNKEKYQAIIGVDFDVEKIKKSVEIVKNSGIDHEFRTTVVPTLHTKQDIIDIAKYLYPVKFASQPFNRVNPVKFASQPFNRVNPSKYFLQNFRRLGDKIIDKNLKEDPNFLLEIYKEIPKGFNVKIRN